MDLNYSTNLIFPVPIHQFDVNGFSEIQSDLIDYAYKLREKDPIASKKSNQGGWQSIDFDVNERDEYLRISSLIRRNEKVENNQFKNAFCLARPPGHHADKNKAMGFCCISNAGVATNYLINKYKYKKIACVDFDVHWGNGNYDVMRGNKNSLYISTHQYPFYPGGGTDKDKGDFNNSLNIPLPAGTNSEEYFNAFDRVLERLVRYKPDFLLFSAGFDAHKDDPLAQFELSSKDFYEITKRTLIATNKFTNGKVVSILEGGYDLNALAESANEHVNALLEFC